MCVCIHVCRHLQCSYSTRYMYMYIRNVSWYYKLCTYVYMYYIRRILLYCHRLLRLPVSPTCTLDNHSTEPPSNKNYYTRHSTSIRPRP